MRTAALVLALVVAGCGETEDKAEPEWRGPPPVTEAEKRRGVAACQDYKTQVCACAERDERHAADCRMADSRIEALSLSLDIAGAEAAQNPGGDNDSSRALAISNARRVMRRCIEQVAELARVCR